MFIHDVRALNYSEHHCRGAMQAIARGADLNRGSEGPQADSLAADVEETYIGPPRSSGRSRRSSRDQSTAKPPVLFLACKVGGLHKVLVLQALEPTALFP